MNDNSRSGLPGPDPIWVFCEHSDGKLCDVSAQLLTEGRRLADTLGVSLCGVLLGDGLEPLALQVGGWGADAVYLIEHTALKNFDPRAFTKAFSDLAAACTPSCILFGATDHGLDIAPRCSVRLHTGLTADSVELEVDMRRYVEHLREVSTLDVDAKSWDWDDRCLKMTAPAFGGNLMATIVCPVCRPQMCTVRPGVLKAGPFSAERAAACKLFHYTPELDGLVRDSAVVDFVREVRSAVSLQDAQVIVTLGYGIAKDPGGALACAQRLADALGGVVGASRPARRVVDAGWLSEDHLVGQTGKTVRPQLYIAAGVSGAAQHVIAVRDADCVVAINHDASAPIFSVADYGICGDLFRVLPLMAEAAEKLEK